MKDTNEDILFFDDIDPDDFSLDRHTFIIDEFGAEIKTKREYISKLGHGIFFKILTKNEDDINGLSIKNKHDVELRLDINSWNLTVDNPGANRPVVADFYLTLVGTHQDVVKTLNNKAGIGNISDRIMRYFKERAKEFSVELGIGPQEVFDIQVSFYDQLFYRYSPMRDKEYRHKARSLIGKDVCFSFKKQKCLGRLQSVNEGLGWILNNEGNYEGRVIADIEEYKTNAERFILKE